MKYAIGFLLASSLIANIFFICGYKSYAVRVESMNEWKKRDWLVFKSFGEPQMINSNPHLDSIYSIASHYSIILDSMQIMSIELNNKP